MFSCIRREGDAVQEADSINRDQPVQVFGAGVVRVKVVLVVLWGSLQQVGVSFPKQLLQPHCVDRTGRDCCASTTGHWQPIGEFGDGQHVLTGQDWLQSGKWIQGFICQLTVVQTCKRESLLFRRFKDYFRGFLVDSSS